ncbi:MAG: hypothetical protein K6T75_11000 [Acetobacteraceae bacterium]|nr:hypothetical protein [Acetobacteraceae bacterium]
MLKRVRIVSLALAAVLVLSAVAMAAEFNYVVPVVPSIHPWIPRARVDLQVVYDVPLEQQIIRPWLSIFSLDREGTYYYQREVVVRDPQGVVVERFFKESTMTLAVGDTDGAAVDFFVPQKPILPGYKVEFSGKWYLVNDPKYGVTFPVAPILP